MMSEPQVHSIDIVIPLYNESGCIPELGRRLIRVMNDNPRYIWRVIMVENGSHDDTAFQIGLLAKLDSRIHMIKLIRNFGTEGGILAGLSEAKADVAVTMQGDLEDPPELIPSLMREWENGALHVYASIGGRKHLPLWRRTATAGYYRFAAWASDGSIVPNASDFRLLDRRLYVFLRSVPDQNVFLRGLVSWADFPSASVPMMREKRYAGETKFRLGRVVVFALRGILIQSSKPLALLTVVGLLLSAASALGLLYLLWHSLVQGVPFAGFGTLVGLQLLFFGLTMIILGLIGEYLSLVYREVRPRPRFIIKD